MTDDRRTSVVRSVLAGIAGVLAVVGIVAGAIGMWARSSVLDSRQIATTVYEVLGEPEVADALATFVVDEVAATVNLGDQLTEALPDQLHALGPMVLPGLESRVTQRLSEVIQRDDVRRVIAIAVGRAHEQLVDLLKGDGLIDGITVHDGDVTVNLLPLFTRALTFVQGFGLLDDIDVPDIDRSGDPSEQIAEFEDALGRDLPDDFGQVVVYSSDTLASASETLAETQRMFAAVSRAVWVLLIGGVVLAVVSVWLAANRPRAAIILASSVLVLIIAIRLLSRYVVAEAPSLVVRPGAKVTVTEILSRVQDSLTQSTIGYIVIAVVVIVVAALVRPRGGSAPAAEA